MATLNEVWSLARLYEAGLNRDGVLDRPGLNFWIDKLDDGSSFEQIAGGFLYSQEFTRTVGRPVDHLSNREFVNILYNNVLDRDGQDVGVNAWTAALNNGTQTREHVLYRFATSPENVQGSRYVEDLRFENGDWWFPRTVVDAIPANTATSVGIVDGGTITSTIDFVGDRDWIVFDAVAHAEYTVDLFSTGSPNHALDDPFLRIYDSTGALVAENDDDGTTLNSHITFVPTVGGHYYIEASDFDTGTGNYGVSLSSTPIDIAGGPFTTSTIAPGEIVFSRIDFVGDHDWHEIAVTTETVYEITLSGNDASGNSLRDPFLRIFDVNGNLVASDDDSAGDLNATLDFTSSVQGVYYIDAGDYLDDETGSYILEVDAFSADIAEGTATTATVQPNLTSEGSIGFVGDADWFQITMHAGRFYDIYLDGSSVGGNALDDPFLAIYDSSGNILVTDDDSGSGANAYLRFSPSFEDTFYIEANGFGASTGDYTLDVLDTII